MVTRKPRVIKQIIKVIPAKVTQFSQGPNEGYFRSKSIAAVSHKNERFPTLRDKNLVSTLFESTHT